MTSKSRLGSGLLFSAIYLACIGTVSADAFRDSSTPEGWYFYQDPVVKQPIEIPEPVIPEQTEQEKEQKQPTESEEVAITSQWLRENLPKLLDAAQDEPTYENVRRYMYAQRIMIDRANLFSNTYREVYLRETALNESLRRPASSLELTALNREIRKNRRQLFEDHYDDFGVFFFVSSNCQYCEQMVVVLDKLNRRYKLDILPVSVDGSTVQSSKFWADKTVYDDGTLTSTMPIEITPTFYVINKRTMSAIKMATGFATEDRFLDTLLSALNKLEVISNQSYQSTKQVKDIYLIPENTDNGPLTVNEDKLYSDSDYLSDMLRERFEEKYIAPNSDYFSVPGATPSQSHKNEAPNSQKMME